MAIIIDRRKDGKSPSAANRKKFIERYKKYIARSVDEIVRNSKIKDIKKNRTIKIPMDGVDEPSYSTDPETGVRRYVSPGNDQFVKGDRVKKPPPQKGGQGRGGSGDGDDLMNEEVLEVALSKSEFVDLIFEGMALPNYVKESMKSDYKEKLVRAGYTKDGPMSRLSVKKTLQQSLARRIAHKAILRKRLEEAVTEQEKDELKKKKVPYIEDVDLRYNLFTKVKYPTRCAVMFCLMDVSGSMGENERDIARRFFLLLYLFLDRQYENIDVRFIRHAEVAEEVDEHTFFHTNKSGGTRVSSAYLKMLEIIKEEYDPAVYNIYAAQASDGDNFSDDNALLLSTLEEEVLPLVQYLAYLHIANPGLGLWWTRSLYEVYGDLLARYSHFNTASAVSKEEVFEALRGLFTDE